LRQRVKDTIRPCATDAPARRDALRLWRWLLRLLLVIQRTPGEGQRHETQEKEEQETVTH
jgi:hypothetical protein